MKHELKTWIPFFEHILNGRKTFEVRKNDRNYQKFDDLILNEYCPRTKKYTGRRCVARVTYIMQDGHWGMEDGYCVMSIQRIAKG